MVHYPRHLGEWKSNSNKFVYCGPLGFPWILKAPFLLLFALVRLALKCPLWAWRSALWYGKHFKIPLIIFVAIPVVIGFLDPTLPQRYIELCMRLWSILSAPFPDWVDGIPPLLLIASVLVALVKNFPRTPKKEGLADGVR